MTRRLSTGNNAGFTILEMIIVITIMSTLAATYAPRIIEAKYRQGLAREVARNATMIIDAAKLFHYNDPEGDGHDWPFNILELKNYNYISNGWSQTHAFGGSFSLATSGPNLQLNIANIPSDIQNIVRQSVPGWTYVGTTGTSTVPPPGAEASLANKVDKSGDNMWGDLVMTSGANVVVQNAGVNRLVMGADPGGSGTYGLFAQNGALGNLELRADPAGSGSRVNMRGKYVQFLDNSGNLIWQTSDQGAMTLNGATATIAANDIKLRNLNSSVSFSQNNMWLVYMGYHRNGDTITLDSATHRVGTAWSDASYHVFVAPSIFQGANTLAGSAYPVTIVRAWAEAIATAPPSWTIHMMTQDTTGNESTGEQWVLVQVVAAI